MPTVASLRNRIGSAKGYGGCGICKGTWDWKKEHTIPYGHGSGVFPVCEECWAHEAPWRIYKATVELMASWLSDPNLVDREQTEKVVRVLFAVQAALEKDRGWKVEDVPDERCRREFEEAR